MFESFIHPTQFSSVRRYLNYSQSPITAVLFVSDEELLAKVAELLTDEHSSSTRRAKFTRWIENGRLKVGVHSPRLSGERGRDGRLDIDSISDEAQCGVLFLPPYYLVHLRNSPSFEASTGTYAGSSD